jgi:hypothetical protein
MIPVNKEESQLILQQYFMDAVHIVWLVKGFPEQEKR